MTSKAKESQAARRRTVDKNLDQSKLCLYDLKEDGPHQGKPEAQYPDWTEEETFTISGPIGPESKHRGRRFRDFYEALDYYTSLQGGDPVETLQVIAKTSEPLSGSRYGLRFRLPRSEALVASGRSQ